MRDFAARYAASWCSQNPAGVAAFHAVDGSLSINGGPAARGRQAIEREAQAFMTAFPDMRVTFDRLVDSGATVQFHWTLTGTYTGPGGTGKRVHISGFEPHHGWHPQGDGKWYYGLSVENGRVKDEGSTKLRSGLRAVVERLHPGIRLTPLQDILLCDLEEKDRPDLEKMLRDHGIRLSEDVSRIRRYSMACPAIPTCGLAISEAERALPGIVDELDVELKRLGLADETISIRMTGCPNGCVRPYQSDIGIVGRNLGKYTLFVGGNLVGSRLNFVFKDLVPLQDIVSTLLPLLEDYKKNRQESEGFGDYCHRLGQEKLSALGGVHGSST